MLMVNFFRFKHPLFSKKFLAILVVVILSVSAVVFYLNLNNKKSANPNEIAKSNLPYKEKVGEGAWELKNYDPVKQSFATEKTNTNLVENKDAIKSSITNPSDTEIYRWSVTLPNKTVFAFGQQFKDGIFPAVRVTNKDGMFVRYAPKMINTDNDAKISADSPCKSGSDLCESLPLVKPVVKGNVIEWEIKKGIKARYTMMQDRVKADYIVDKASSLQRLASSSNLNKYQLEFNVTSGNQKDSKELLKGELMPEGDIDWFEEIDPSTDSGPIQTHFTFPVPVVFDSKSEARNSKQIQNTKYKIQNTGKAGEYSLAIVLNPNELEKAQFPIVVDPVVIDATATATGTAYGNSRKILRDAWGNLIAVFDGGIGDDNVWYKNYSAATWSDANIDLDAGAGSSVEIAADLDSTGSAHLAFRNTTASAIQYKPLKINRNANNLITSITTHASFSLDTSTFGARPSLIIANKGGGAGVEKIAIAYGMNSTGAGRGEIRFMQCDIADDCTVAANWKNASEEINGSSTCSDTAVNGNAGLPNSATCKGTTDKLFNVAVNTAHHAVLTQIPGKPKRTPASAKKFINAGSTYTNLPLAIDGNSGTNEDVSSLTTSDFIYIGDNNKFSKIVVDVVNTNSGISSIAAEYWNGSAWVSSSSPRDYTKTGAGPFIIFSKDGSLLFDEPTGWTTTAVNGDTAYWVRLRTTGAFDSSVSVADFYITDRNSKALLVVGGVDSTDDLGAAYVSWDELTNSGWESEGTTAGVPWTEGITAMDTLGGNWTTFTNYPLTAAVDYKNNAVYVSYVEDLATDVLHVKYAQNNKDLIIATNWADTSFPTVTEGTDIALSLTADGSDIYLFYVLDPGTNSLVFRKCTPSGGGDGNKCDNASDWGSEKTLVSETDLSHPQAVVTKVTGDTVAIDTIYTMPTASDVYYERHYVDLADKTVVVAVSGDDGYHRNCYEGPGSDQDISSVNVKLGEITSDLNCNSSLASLNHAGFRFPNIVVPQGAFISSAYVDFRVSEKTGGAVNFTVYGEDADSPGGFSALTDCIEPCSGAIGNSSSRVRTMSNSVQSIDFTTNTYRIDVTDIVQEIVCRGASNTQPCVGNFNGSGTWASGNALNLLLISTAGGSGWASIVSFEDTQSILEPTLQINLVPSGTTGKLYSLGSATQLATGAASFADLDHPLSSVEMLSVATDDTNYASVSATTNYASSSAVPAFMFKVNNSNNDNTYKIDATSIVRSSVPTTSKPIHLQVYRGGATDDWITRATNNSSAADTDITLTAQQVNANLADYYFNETPGIGTRYAECTNATANCWSYWRLYQDSVGTDQNAVLSLDYVNISFTSAAAEVPSAKLKGGVIFRGGSKIR